MSYGVPAFVWVHASGCTICLHPPAPGALDRPLRADCSLLGAAHYLSNELFFCVRRSATHTSWTSTFTSPDSDSHSIMVPWMFYRHSHIGIPATVCRLPKHCRSPQINRRFQKLLRPMLVTAWTSLGPVVCRFFRTGVPVILGYLVYTFFLVSAELKTEVLSIGWKLLDSPDYVLKFAGSSRATARPGETFSRDPQTFLWGSFREINFNFFQNGTFWCIFVFLSDDGAPNIAGPGVAYLPTPSSRQAWKFVAPQIPRIISGHRFAVIWRLDPVIFCH